jgi:hypothetical protein
MAFTKRVAAQDKSNQERAIRMYTGFLTLVEGRVKKEGIENVMQAYQPAFGPPSQHFWLKKCYERALDFAEQTQLKQMPVKGEFSGNITLLDLVKNACS